MDETARRIQHNVRLIEALEARQTEVPLHGDLWYEVQTKIEKLQADNMELLLNVR